MRQKQQANPRLSQMWEDDVRNVDIPLPQLISLTNHYDEVAPDEIPVGQPAIALATIKINTDDDTEHIHVIDTDTTQDSNDSKKEVIN